MFFCNFDFQLSSEVPTPSLYIYIELLVSTRTGVWMFWVVGLNVMKGADILIIIFLLNKMLEHVKFNNRKLKHNFVTHSVAEARENKNG